MQTIATNIMKYLIILPIPEVSSFITFELQLSEASPQAFILFEQL